MNGPAEAPPSEDIQGFWRPLLRQRVVAGWGNFSWLSPKSLLSSINDQVAKLIEEPGEPGAIVERRRMRWVAAQRSRAVDAGLPVRIPTSQGLLVLGDPGEMDASQYVMVRDLSRLCERLSSHGIDAALLMSDIVYPAGDINQWVDAVYLPYFGLPRSAWDEAMDEWLALNKHAEPELERFEPPLTDWHVLATPGNHDWYDGLDGFMYHACGAEALPDVSHDPVGYTLRQRLARAWWRTSAAPKRELIQPIRSQVAARPGRIGIPNLPGPYYAVELGCALHEKPVEEDCAGCPPALLALMLDNGITGAIDVEQAAWLERMLCTHKDVPTVVVTGKPAVVDEKINDLRISNYPRAGSRQLMDVLHGHPQVVATVAGDIHNYQRLRLRSACSGSGRGRDDGTLPPLQIVAGGAGAFLAATHTVKLGAGDELSLTTEWGGPTALAQEIAAPDHERFPRREESVLHYAIHKARMYTVVLTGLLLMATVALASSVHFAEQVQALSVWDDTELPAWALLMGPLVALAAALVAIGLSSKVGIPVGACFALLATLGWYVLTGAPGLVVAAASAIGIAMLAVAQFVSPVLRNFPRLHRNLTFRIALLALGAFTVVQLQKSLPLVPSLLLIAMLMFLAREAYQSLHRWLDGLRTAAIGQRGGDWVQVLGLTRVAVTAVLLVTTTIAMPGWILARLNVQDAAGWGHLVSALSSLTLCLTLTGLLLWLVALPMWGARRTAPLGVEVVVVTTILGAVGIVIRQWLDAEITIAGAGGALAVALLGSNLVGLRRLKGLDSPLVRTALRCRDGAGGRPQRRSALFLAMTIAGITKVENLAEATEPPFAKNALVISMERDMGKDPRATRIAFTALGLNRESREVTRTPTGAGGFFPIEKITVDPTTHEVRVDRGTSGVPLPE